VQATEIAVETVRAALRTPTSIRHVIFACFDREVLDAYAAAGVSGLDD
jgi:O-acetyl-ADP-ribose deacetylase (regulator of RNase III)